MTAISRTAPGLTRRSDSTPEGKVTPLWYAVYTHARHEKRVAEELTSKAVENYLPLYQSIHQWKNGRHVVYMPLFPGYVFVRIRLRDCLSVLQVRGVVDLVGFNGKPVALADDEVTNLVRALESGRLAEPHPFISRGRNVRITAGPLVGLRGIVMRTRGRAHVVLSLDLIRRSVRVEIHSTELEPLL